MTDVKIAHCIFDQTFSLKVCLDLQLRCLAMTGRCELLCRLYRMTQTTAKIEDPMLIATALVNSVGAELGLVRSAEGGMDGVVRALLEWPEDAPRADCKSGQALLCAARSGHDVVVRTLLNWPKNAPRANCMTNQVLAMAAHGGHEPIVRTLLGWPKHAPRANCNEGWSLVLAVHNGHDKIVKMLLEWPDHAPRADCQDGWALALALSRGHDDVVKTLLERWPEDGYSEPLPICDSYKF